MNELTQSKEAAPAATGTASHGAIEMESIAMPNLIPALNDINVPDHVNVKPVDSFEFIMAEIARRSMKGYSGEVLFGTAFVQGQRLQFTTAMPIQKMVDISKMDRSAKQDNVVAVMEHANRPFEAGHGRNLRSYLLDTACAGDKFILPAFTFNYGVGLEEDAPAATLMVMASEDDGANAWPAVLMLPTNAVLDTTDGAHRRSQIVSILQSDRVADEQKDALRRNAVDVKIVFEGERNASHQDFADCGRAKPIAKSLIASFDIRDAKNKRGRDLVLGHDFLRHYVDATAANVNLSSKSKKIWSMSAVRLFVSHVDDHHLDVGLSVEEKTAGAEDFFTALSQHLPQLRALDEARSKADGATTGSLRNRRGGDIALRGIGMAVFARAFLFALENDLSWFDVASKLGEIDWNVLDCEKDALPEDETFGERVFEHANGIWAHLLVIREKGYRISSTAKDADQAWQKIQEAKFSEVKLAA